ncbi:hypothetical protein [Rhizobium sp. LCM 4573]|uniref:hypothetical protein n=1 Tax=Rhizobium sp. LCM 4573 TaxID=1848291 RepID=UPI0008D99F39|nr:hypothetical protein [Rhizobium sp. LCM 4573]OHV83687.1 hypothetical protein LCM4573_06155 [Rhizobium sp. LCM 4573]
MTDDEYAYLVASHGAAVPVRDRLRLHDCQLPALDSLLRVMREEGLDAEVRITGIVATASGRTQIEKELAAAVDPRSAQALCLEISFWAIERRFEEIVCEEFADD